MWGEKERKGEKAEIRARSPLDKTDRQTICVVKQADNDRKCHSNGKGDQAPEQKNWASGTRAELNKKNQATFNIRSSRGSHKAF